MITDPLLVTELYRETGEYDTCLELLSKYKAEEEHVEAYVKKIKDRAIAYNPKVFIIDKAARL